MKWSNLRRNKCPKCNHDLMSVSVLDKIIECKNDQCSFQISEERFSEIVLNMNKEGLARAEYRQGEQVEDLMKSEFD